MRDSLSGQGETTAIYCKNGEFHSDPSAPTLVNFTARGGGGGVQFLKRNLAPKPSHQENVISSIFLNLPRSSSIFPRSSSIFPPSSSIFLDFPRSSSIFLDLFALPRSSSIFLDLPSIFLDLEIRMMGF